MAASVPFSQLEPNWLSSPGPLGVATSAVTIVLGIFTVLLVLLRSWTRIQTGTYGLDDGLMVVGMVSEGSCY